MSALTTFLLLLIFCISFFSPAVLLQVSSYWGAFPGCGRTSLARSGWFTPTQKYQFFEFIKITVKDATRFTDIP